MRHYPILQILFIVFLILSFISGRTLFEDDTDKYSDEYEDQQNSQLNPLSFFPDNTKREFHQRSAFPSSNTSQTRQQIIDLLRKAYNQGWKPNLKHYIPGTRFGRHNR